MSDRVERLPVWLKRPQSDPGFDWSAAKATVTDATGTWCLIGEAANWSDVAGLLGEHAERLFLENIGREPGMRGADAIVLRCACLETLHSLYGSGLDEALRPWRRVKVTAAAGRQLHGYLIDPNLEPQLAVV
jgi:hypothetical protein